MAPECLRRGVQPSEPPAIIHCRASLSVAIVLSGMRAVVIPTAGVGQSLGFDHKLPDRNGCVQEFSYSHFQPAPVTWPPRQLTVEKRLRIWFLLFISATAEAGQSAD